LLIRPYESEAAYAPKKEQKMISIIQKISNEFTNYNVLLLARYSSQIKKLKNKLGKKIIVLDHVVDNNEIFSLTDVFIGSGGTMTAEAALRGIPTISYNAIPNIVENYLVKKGLVIREVNPNRIVSLIRKLLKTNNELIKKKVNLMYKTLVQDFEISKPKIALLGLNPHCGDNGVIGNEDDEIIKPTVKELQEEGKIIYGPFAADGFFGSKAYQQFDAILAMYHDQGLAPFKTLSFGKGVNFTAGLNKVRTSPDHGTAFEIAGKNLADESSFKEALFMAIEIYKKRSDYQELTRNTLRRSKR